MTTIETPKLPMGYRHQVLGDVYAVPELGDRVIVMNVDDGNNSYAHVWAIDETDDGRALLAAVDWFAADMGTDPTVNAQMNSGTDWRACTVTVAGTYRGVPFKVLAVLSGPAALDLIPSFEPGRALLVALAGDQPQVSGKPEPKECPTCHGAFEVDGQGYYLTHRIGRDGEQCSTGPAMVVSGAVYVNGVPATAGEPEHVSGVLVAEVTR